MKVKQIILLGLLFLGIAIVIALASTSFKVHKSNVTKPPKIALSRSLPSRGSLRPPLSAVSTPTPIPAPPAPVVKPQSPHVHPQAVQAPALVPQPPTTDLAVRINNYLGSSPMAGLGEVFVSEANKYGNDPRVSVGIAMTESGLGRATPTGSFNPYGMTCGCAKAYSSGCVMGFDRYGSWANAIAASNWYMSNYIKRGVTSPSQLGDYAADPGWEGKVLRAMNSI